MRIVALVDRQLYVNCSVPVEATEQKTLLYYEYVVDRRINLSPW